MENIENWEEFTNEFSKRILPIYKEHENSFDQIGIHGRLHISRALIFSEFMSRFYHKSLKINNIDFAAIRYAIAFHDSGRKENGVDLWESDSAELCAVYLKANKTKFDTIHIYYISKLIEKKGRWDSHKKIVHDADVLEIMRPCCGHGGRSGFHTNALRFLSVRDDYIDKNYIEEFAEVRNELIEEAWKLIQYTEKEKQTFNDQNNKHITILLNYIYSNKKDYPLLNQYLE